MIKLVSILLVSMSLLLGCTSESKVSKEYSAKVKQVEIGMSKKEFYNLFSNAIPRGAKQYPNGIVEVLEVTDSYYSFTPTGNRNRNPLTGMEQNIQWFYFYNEQLVQYGNPNDWPAEPDKIIEIRHR
ncbi:MAG: hypothetical protein F9K22_11995 [Bacteroidetes bacterium]|nr:MAG: hypothetical protein F9K22_11995 [Bacteroidota bacterium]